MSNNGNGTKVPLLETVIAFFVEDEWQFDKVEDISILTTGIQGENGSWRCYAKVDEDLEQFAFYSVLPTNIPDHKRMVVSEYLTRANCGLSIGNFELDFEDGEVRFKTSVDVTGSRLTTTMVKTMVYVNILMMDRYLPGIMSVAYAGASPADEIAKAES